MDWHRVISVQQQTHDNDFRHFTISNVSLRFAFWAFFRKPEKLGSYTGSKWWPSDPVTRTWKMTQMTHWPGDPMTQFHVWSTSSPQQIHNKSKYNGVRRLLCLVWIYPAWLFARRRARVPAAEDAGRGDRQAVGSEASDLRGVLLRADRRREVPDEKSSWVGQGRRVSAKERLAGHEQPRR